MPTSVVSGVNCNMLHFWHDVLDKSIKWLYVIAVVALSEIDVLLWTQVHWSSDGDVVVAAQFSHTAMICCSCSVFVNKRLQSYWIPLFWHLNICEWSMKSACWTGVFYFVFMLSKPICNWQWGNVNCWSWKLVWSPNTEIGVVFTYTKTTLNVYKLHSIIWTPGIAWDVCLWLVLLCNF